MQAMLEYYPDFFLSRQVYDVLQKPENASEGGLHVDACVRFLF